MSDWRERVMWDEERERETNMCDLRERERERERGELSIFDSLFKEMAL
jgi:hypothetical protein